MKGHGETFACKVAGKPEVMEDACMVESVDEIVAFLTELAKEGKRTAFSLNVWGSMDMKVASSKWEE